jgi:hypothetical protein
MFIAAGPEVQLRRSTRGVVPPAFARTQQSEIAGGKTDEAHEEDGCDEHDRKG